MADENPKVNLSWTSLFCPRHGEPFRAEWPKGATLSCVGMFHAATHDERIAAAAGGDANQLTRVIMEFGPMCCFLGDTITNEVTRMALAGSVYGHEPRGDGG